MFKARLIAVTTPVDGTGMEDAKDLIAYCARVSNPKNQMNMDTAQKLIDYLKRMRHWSPLDMANCVVEAEAPRDIMRQLLRHWSLRPQEFSQRYQNVNELGNAFMIREARLQDDKNRQNSLQTDNEDLKQWWRDSQEEILTLVKTKYAEAIERGIALECARVILPEGNTMSRAYFNGTIRSWIHYLDVRLEEGVTQQEHVELARLIADQVNKSFKVA
jgi:thymidylate synthase (FAD)